MQKTPLGNPASAFDQFLMHDRNLPRRPAETDEAEFEPEAKRFSQADGLGFCWFCFDVRGGREAQAKVPCEGANVDAWGRAEQSLTHIAKTPK
jgi:hypothetical protein